MLPKFVLLTAFWAIWLVVIHGEPEHTPAVHIPFSTVPDAIQVRLPLSDRATPVKPGRAQASWWNGVSQGKWEYETFRVFNQEVRVGFTYIGFGEWVGVTGLFAGQRASKLILMDADPTAFKELSMNAQLNADTMPQIYLDNRCISGKKEVVDMHFNGGSGSSIVHQAWTDAMPVTKVDCLPLPSLLAEYGVTDFAHLFVKIDTEGAESLILPTLLPWLQAMNQTELPTIFVSMHAASNEEQRGKIAELLNLYPFYAIVMGRNEKLKHGTEGLDVGVCKEGMQLHHNKGERFTAGHICLWCDYLLVTNRDGERAKCHQHYQIPSIN